MAELTQKGPAVRIFVNAKPVDAQPSEPVIEAIHRWDSALAGALRDGSRALTDSRGLVTALDAPVYAGAIYRIVSGRQLQANDDPFADVS
jgi:hypothetical protein